LAYVDTSVLVAAYTPEDQLHDASRSFLKKARTSKIISPLSFEELSAVLSRTEQNLELPASLLSEPLARRIRAVVEYIIRDSDLTLASGFGASRVNVGGRRVSIPVEYWQAARLAPVLRMRALDLLHLACARLIDRLQVTVKVFVTGDKGILSKSAEIEQSVQVQVKHPEEML
jgi:predicted nucleic acid-binding protein